MTGPKTSEGAVVGARLLRAARAHPRCLTAARAVGARTVRGAAAGARLGRAVLAHVAVVAGARATHDVAVTVRRAIIGACHERAVAAAVLRVALALARREALAAAGALVRARHHAAVRAGEPGVAHARLAAAGTGHAAAVEGARVLGAAAARQELGARRAGVAGKADAPPSHARAVARALRRAVALVDGSRRRERELRRLCVRRAPREWGHCRVGRLRGCWREGREQEHASPQSRRQPSRGRTHHADVAERKMKLFRFGNSKS